MCLAVHLEFWETGSMTLNYNQVAEALLHFTCVLCMQHELKRSKAFNHPVSAAIVMLLSPQQWMVLYGGPEN